jgi:hypothetical protein
MPSLSRLYRQLSEIEDRARDQGKPESEIYHILDGLLTNFILDLNKDDPEYKAKSDYFYSFLQSGKFPNASLIFESRGHQASARVQPAYRTGGKKTRGKGKKLTRTRRTRRRRY